jgi:hypothetical protein
MYSMSEKGSDELLDQVELENGPISPIKGQPKQMKLLRFNSLAAPSPSSKGKPSPNHRFASQKTCQTSGTMVSEVPNSEKKVLQVHEAKVARVQGKTRKGRQLLDKGQREALGAYKESLARFVGAAMLQDSKISLEKPADTLNKSETIEQPGVIEMLQSPNKKQQSQGLMHLQMLRASKDITGMGTGISEIEKILQVLGYTDDRYFRLIEVHLAKIADH